MCIAISEDRIENLHGHLNGIEPSIQLMVEVEAKGLSIQLQYKPDRSISASVF